MKIKVCGMRDIANIQQLTKLAEVGYMGLIFYKKSSRYVEENALLLQQLQQTKLEKVGVFVNADSKEIEKTISTFGLDVVQLHGQESPELCKELQQQKITVVKAVSIGDATDLQRLKSYVGACDFFLLDTKGKLPGGNGYKFDWSVLQNYTEKVPFFLSGGIGPEDWAEILKINHPQFYGIDVNSGFELEPALKNIDSLKNFLRKLELKQLTA